MLSVMNTRPIDGTQRAKASSERSRRMSLRRTIEQSPVMNSSYPADAEHLLDRPANRAFVRRHQLVAGPRR